ncbi:MAG: 30S ribosomal protein S12 methylthiotransferase RimO [Lentisphaeria bacterium]|nr:30S ribosomal protein S12 methylthiotransferase RimO [Lentisphaeria bacterium]
MKKSTEEQRTRPYLVRLVSLGCPKNTVDTGVAAGALLVDGFGLTADDDEADVMWINTCAFLLSARKEAMEEIRRACAWKKRRAGRLVVVAGCLPQWDKDGAVRAKYPLVDAWEGIDSPAGIGAVLKRLIADKPGPERKNVKPCSWIYDETTPRLPVESEHFAYLKIADGCCNCCTYCLIPSIRGALRSRTVQSVVAEAKSLAEQGFRELILIAQDTGAFGRDRSRDGKSELPELLAALDKLPGEFRLRLMYVHPASIDDAMIRAFRKCRRLIPHIEMPVQHVSDAVMAAMNRHITAERQNEVIRKLREAGFTIRTTLMTGFPGETETDFQMLLDAVKARVFSRIGVFAFSPEDGTPAASMKGRVPAKTAAARAAMIAAEQEKISRETNRALVGQTLEIILDEDSGRGRWRGRMLMDAPDIDQTVHVSKCPAGLTAGMAVPVTITRAAAYDLYGTYEPEGRTPGGKAK